MEIIREDLRGYPCQLFVSPGPGWGRLLCGVRTLCGPLGLASRLLTFVGNTERGWNDPPQFSYGLQTQAGGPKRSPLTKRVAAPQDGSPRGA